MGAMFRRIATLVMFAAACGGSTQRVEQTPLITRPSEPMLPRPQRTSAVRVPITAEMELVIADMLAAEATSNEALAFTGLRWSDGRTTVAVAHVRYPHQDMTEEAVAATVDDARLEQCDIEHQDCLDSGENCREDAYEACMRSAYRDQYVYMSSHLGLECGVFELSTYELQGNAATLSDRRTLELLACDHAVTGLPAATDLDGDGGPELTYVWSASRAAGWDDDMMVETVVIVDGNDLHEQLRLSQEATEDDSVSMMGLATRDTDGDGFADLVASVVAQRGYCSGYGWSLDKRFVLPEDELVEDGACEVTIKQQKYPYDVSRDSWMPAEGAP